MLAWNAETSFVYPASQAPWTMRSKDSITSHPILGRYPQICYKPFADRLSISPSISKRCVTAENTPDQSIRVPHASGYSSTVRLEFSMERH